MSTPREQLGGYFLIDVPDLDNALSWAARCPGASHGAVEVPGLAHGRGLNGRCRRPGARGTPRQRRMPPSWRHAAATAAGHPGRAHARRGRGRGRAVRGLRGRRTRGAQAGLQALQPLAADRRLADYQAYWAARAELLLQAGDRAQALQACTRAIGLESDPAVRRFLQRRTQAAGAGTPPRSAPAG